MFREILTSRAIVIGVVFFVLVAVSSLLYNWHVRSEIAAELERSDQVMQQLENKKEKHTTQDAGVSIGTDRVGETERSLETDDPQTMSEETKALPRGEVSDYLEMAEVFLPDETTGEGTGRRCRYLTLWLWSISRIAGRVVIQYLAAQLPRA